MKMTKWLSGIAATVIGGLLLWWLTHEGGPLKPKAPPRPKESPAPTVRLLDADIDVPDVSKTYGDRIKGTFVVYNEGDATAERCILWLLDGGSERFGLAPGERRKVVALSSSLFREHGTYRIVARISCESYERTLYSEGHAF